MVARRRRGNRSLGEFDPLLSVSADIGGKAVEIDQSNSSPGAPLSQHKATHRRAKVVFRGWEN